MYNYTGDITFKRKSRMRLSKYDINSGKTSLYTIYIRIYTKISIRKSTTCNNIPTRGFHVICAFQNYVKNKQIRVNIN